MKQISKRETATFQNKKESLLKDKAMPGTINDFDCCPHCGDDYGYFRKHISRGITHDCIAFDHFTRQNTEMWDAVTDIWSSKYLYCVQCEEPICKA